MVRDDEVVAAADQHIVAEDGDAGQDADVESGRPDRARLVDERLRGVCGGE